MGGDDFPDLKEFMESIKVVDQKVYALKEPNLDFIAKKEREYLDKWFCKLPNFGEAYKIQACRSGIPQKRNGQSPWRIDP